MIQVIGVKKILVLLLLVAANAALAAVTYLYVQPEAQKLERQLRSTKTQISQKQADTERLRNEFDEIQARKQDFETLTSAGFVSDQNRLVARRRITDIQKYSKVLRASYDIGAANIVKNKMVTDIEHVILQSPVKVSVEALDDIDFYSFIYWMESAFPGHVAVTNMTVQRTSDVSEVSLRQIGSGLPMTLVKGNVEFVWRTLAPESDVHKSDEFGPGGF
ncbi:MAG: hypothetical protein H6867_09445 [Rhodospirillales bacterium]|nr:hypothetical protein [Rhodospirillales bacterium]MCB9995986.1 hypothetical protein [Rhodospirillales bacterium]